MLKKAINHVIQKKNKERIKILMKLYRKRGMDYSQKATSIPLYLKSKERKMEGMNTTLYFWRKEKNQEVLMCFCIFWERNMVRKERKNA